MVRIINPESITIEDREDMEALRDVCDLAYHYAKAYAIAGMSEQRRQRALVFAQKIWGSHIHFVEHEVE